MITRLLLLFVVLLLEASCSQSESLFGPGLHQKVRVQQAQLQQGSLSPDEGGPSVSSLLRPQPEVRRGESGVAIHGRLAPGGVALHLQAEGDTDHWVVPAQGFDFVETDELEFTAQLNFSHSIPEDTLRLRVQAVDKDGRFGPVETTEFILSEEKPSAQLLVSIAWDRASDVDLYLQTPDGTIVGSKNINSYEPPVGTAPPPDAWMEGGYLDYDSNQHCELDLVNQENILWIEEPPSGQYRIYAGLFSACGQGTTSVLARAEHQGVELGQAAGQLYEFDARELPSDGQAPGLLLMEFSIP